MVYPRVRGGGGRIYVLFSVLVILTVKNDYNCLTCCKFQSLKNVWLQFHGNSLKAKTTKGLFELACFGRTLNTSDRTRLQNIRMKHNMFDGSIWTYGHRVWPLLNHRRGNPLNRTFGPPSILPFTVLSILSACTV